MLIPCAFTYRKISLRDPLQMEKSLLKTVATLFLFRNYAIIFFETTSFDVAPVPTKHFVNAHKFPLLFAQFRHRSFQGRENISLLLSRYVFLTCWAILNHVLSASKHHHLLPKEAMISISFTRLRNLSSMDIIGKSTMSFQGQFSGN